MLLTIQQIAKLISYSDQGTRKLLQRLRVPLHKNKKQWWLQTKDAHSFIYSITLQLQYPHLQIMYSIMQLATRHHKHQKTIRKLLQDNDIPMYGSTKKYVFLYDLQQFEKRIGIFSQ